MGETGSVGETNRNESRRIEEWISGLMVRAFYNDFMVTKAGSEPVFNKSIYCSSGTHIFSVISKPLCNYLGAMKLRLSQWNVAKVTNATSTPIGDPLFSLPFP